MLINKRESTGLKHFNDSKLFIKYLNDMNDIYKNVEEYNPNKKRKILIVFDDMTVEMLTNKKLNLVVTKLSKTKHFSCFYYAILFCCVKNY